MQTSDTIDTREVGGGPTIITNLNSENYPANNYATTADDDNSDNTNKTGAPSTFSHPDRWVRDEAVQECTQCKRQFTIFLRKHHCRWCGRIYCDKCSSGRLALTPKHPQQHHRVCDTCFTHLTSSESPLPPLLRQTAIMPTTGSKNGISSISSRQNSQLLSPRPESINSEISVIEDCPVCGTRFDVDFSKDDVEAHVGECLRKISSGGKGMMINGNRYVGKILLHKLLPSLRLTKTQNTLYTSPGFDARLAMS